MQKNDREKPPAIKQPQPLRLLTLGFSIPEDEIGLLTIAEVMNIKGLMQ